MIKHVNARLSYRKYLLEKVNSLEKKSLILLHACILPPEGSGDKLAQLLRMFIIAYIQMDVWNTQTLTADFTVGVLNVMEYRKNLCLNALTYVSDKFIDTENKSSVIDYSRSVL